MTYHPNKKRDTPLYSLPISLLSLKKFTEGRFILALSLRGHGPLCQEVTAEGAQGSCSHRTCSQEAEEVGSRAQLISFFSFIAGPQPMEHWQLGVGLSSSISLI